MASENDRCYFHVYREIRQHSFLPGQFWPSLSFASLSVPSGMAPSPVFLSCGPKLRHLNCCDMNLCGDRVERGDLNWSRQLLSQLRIKDINSKIIKIQILHRMNFNLRFRCCQRITYPRKCPCSSNLGSL